MELRSRSVLESQYEAQHPIKPKIRLKQSFEKPEGTERTAAYGGKIRKSRMGMSSAHRKRTSMKAENDNDEQTLLPIKRLRQKSRLQSQNCERQKDDPMDSMFPIEMFLRNLPETFSEVQHPLSPRDHQRETNAKQMKRKKNTRATGGLIATDPAKRKIISPTRRSTRTIAMSSSSVFPGPIEHKYNHKRGTSKRNECKANEKEIISRATGRVKRNRPSKKEENRIHFDYVQNEANIFKVYRYVLRRINDAIDLCKDGAISPLLCSESICIIFSNDQSTTSNNFGETFSNIQHGPIDTILDKDPSVIVFIGANEESFATIRQEAAVKSMPPVICKVTRATDRDTEGKPCTKEWGFESFAKDLSKDNVVEYVDAVLEYYAFEMLDRATKQLPDSSERTSRVIAQVKSFYSPIMPEPELIKREKTGHTITRMAQISKKVLALPQVFACDVTKDSMKVMILKKDEKAREEVTHNLKMMGLSDEEFFVHIVYIRPLAIGQITIGAEVSVPGSEHQGTLGGFAKFKHNNTATNHVVAITARHVVNGHVPLHVCVNNQTIGTVMEDESTYDISIAKVTAPEYDTRFKTESGDFGFAELCHLNQDDLRYKAVHFHGATTGLAKANISEISIGDSFAGGYILMEICNEENSAFAKPGDSGAMILMERDPRDSENMFALGTLVGEVLLPKENNADISAGASRTKLTVEKAKQTFVQLTDNPPLSEDPTLSDDPTRSNDVPPSDDTRSSSHPMTFNSPTQSSEGSLPTKEPHNTIPSTDTLKTYAIVPLKNGFDQLSKKHGGSLELFTRPEMNNETVLL